MKRKAVVLKHSTSPPVDCLHEGIHLMILGEEHLPFPKRKKIYDEVKIEIKNT